MNTDTPETNAAKRPSGLRACADGLDANPDKDFAQKCMRHAADRMEQLERERDEIRAQLREEQQLHVQTLNERDEARETSWFSNGIEYRKRNDYIEARNNLNPHWVVVDSPTNQKP